MPATTDRRNLHLTLAEELRKASGDKALQASIKRKAIQDQIKAGLLPSKKSKVNERSNAAPLAGTC